MLSRVLVTGYGGFLGEQIVRQLVTQNYHVRGLARSRYPKLTELGVETVQGDASDPDVCFQAVQGCDAVIHVAAIAGVGGQPSLYQRINVDATANLLAACAEHHVSTFVFCSSPSVVFAGAPQQNISETTPYPQKFLADYPRTKAAAEKLVLERNGEGLRTCALRPHLIWGANDNHLTPRLIEKAKSGRLRIVGDGSNIIDTVHVDAAAAAHILALERLLKDDANVAGQAFFITDGQPIRCWEWIGDILTTAGISPPSKRISLRAAYRLGHAFEILYRSLRLNAEPPMTRFVALQLGMDHYYDITAARHALGYQAIDDRDVILRSLQPWLRSLA